MVFQSVGYSSICRVISNDLHLPQTEKNAFVKCVDEEEKIKRHSEFFLY